jgi:UDP-glucose 4-epimerase
MAERLDWQGSNILITGGLGFIGSTLARRLAGEGARVVVVDNLFPDYGGNRFNLAGIEDNLTIEIADVRDAAKMRSLLEGKDFLFNLAGQTSHMDSMTNPQRDMEINCEAQLGILEACREVNSSLRIVFASTRQLYGRPGYLPVDEKHPIHPVDVNGINKLAGEWYHRLYSEVYGIRSTVLRLTNTYGPRMRIKDARQTFVGIWFRRILEGEPFEVWGGTQLRDFTYVEDCVDALLLAASTEAAAGQMYNLGGVEPVTLLALAEQLVAVAKRGSFVVRDFPADRKAIEIGDYYSDFSLIRKELGWAPKVSLADGLRHALDFYTPNLAEYL